MTDIHPTAIVAPGAAIGGGARIGPWCQVGPDVVLGEGVELVTHVVIDGHTSDRAGRAALSVLHVGLAPQDLKYRGEPTRTEIGARTPDPRARDHPSRHRHRAAA